MMEMRNKARIICSK
uniref:Uncharacterized protein n=1 Tax=Arundo donax TaxID=35708 RepID=A0A0A9VEM8_ARUDO